MCAHFGIQSNRVHSTPSPRDQKINAEIVVDSTKKTAANKSLCRTTLTKSRVEGSQKEIPTTQVGEIQQEEKVFRDIHQHLSVMMVKLPN